MATPGVSPMKEKSITDALLREFLLGKISEEERERIENLFLIDSQLRDRVLALEQDLIEDYLEDSLTPKDKERFLLIYAQTSEQRRNLRITQSIKDWAVTEARASQAATATASVWSGLRERLRLTPVFVSIITMMVIAIVLAIFWLNSWMGQRRHSALEQELLQLNSPASLREVPPQMSSLDLRPVAVRSAGPETRLNPNPEIQTVELRLPWIRKDRYSTYQAEVHRLGDNDSYIIPNLHPENDGGLVRIRLPARMLIRGQYQVNLSGVASDGSPSSPEEYQLAVGGYNSFAIFCLHRNPPLNLLRNVSQLISIIYSLPD
jgi:uncharacterized protein YggT (Ycf19 family)